MIKATIVPRHRSGKMLLIFVFGLGLSIGFIISNIFAPFSPCANSIYVARNFKYWSKPNSSSDISVHHDSNLNSSFALELLKGVEETKTRQIAEEVRIMCLIITYKANHKKKAIHVRNTWARHCNHVIFVTDEESPDFPTLVVKSKGRGGLWLKTATAFKHVYENYNKEQYDWVIKADDDTYVVLENLRDMLLPYKPRNPHYFGFHFKPEAPYGYMSGGAGYVLSKESVRLLVTEGFDGNHKQCKNPFNEHPEDINMGKCMAAVGVKPGDSRDAQGRSRFFPFSLEIHLSPRHNTKTDWWYWNYIVWPMEGGLSICSDKPVSFHYVNPARMYMLEYLIYQVKTFSVMHLDKAIPFPVTDPPEIDFDISSTTIDNDLYTDPTDDYNETDAE